MLDPKKIPAFHYISSLNTCTCTDEKITIPSELSILPGAKPYKKKEEKARKYPTPGARPEPVVSEPSSISAG